MTQRTSDEQSLLGMGRLLFLSPIGVDKNLMKVFEYLQFAVILMTMTSTLGYKDRLIVSYPNKKVVGYTARKAQDAIQYIRTQQWI